MENFNGIMTLICMVAAIIMLACNQVQYATYFVALAIFYRIEVLKQKQ